MEDFFDHHEIISLTVSEMEEKREELRYHDIIHCHVENTMIESTSFDSFYMQVARKVIDNVVSMDSMVYITYRPSETDDMAMDPETKAYAKQVAKQVTAKAVDKINFGKWGQKAGQLTGRGIGQAITAAGATFGLGPLGKTIGTKASAYLGKAGKNAGKSLKVSAQQYLAKP
jgi:hypothetical protein